MPTLCRLLTLLFLASTPASAGGWEPRQRVDTYAVEGTTGTELYASIGRQGPKVGRDGNDVQTIAYTTFDLKWSRDYRPGTDGACRLVSARPHLTIITVLPKPSGALPPQTKAAWDVFIQGIRDHEAYHAHTIVDMVKQIEAYSVGLTVADDPKCRRIREVLTKRLSELSQEQRAKGRAFDRIEMGDGGNIQRLIAALVAD